MVRNGFAQQKLGKELDDKLGAVLSKGERPPYLAARVDVALRVRSTHDLSLLREGGLTRTGQFFASSFERAS